MQDYIYVVFSSTPYAIGKAIRCFTGEHYNHVSISLDPELEHMYGFSRRYCNVPFYGGFVKESRDRYHLNGKIADIAICKIPVTKRQYVAIKARLRQMHKNQDLYLYNHMSIFGSVLHRPVRIRGAYTCVEFGVFLLSKLDLGVDPNKYYTVEDLLSQLIEYQIYTGPMPADSARDSNYYAKKSLPYAARSTVRDFVRLIPRAKTR